MKTPSSKIIRIQNGIKYEYEYKNIMVKKTLWDRLDKIAKENEISIPRVIQELLNRDENTKTEKSETE